MFRSRQTPADPWQRKNLLRFPRVAVTGRSQVRGQDVGMPLREKKLVCREDGLNQRHGPGE